MKYCIILGLTVIQQSSATFTRSLVLLQAVKKNSVAISETATICRCTTMGRQSEKNDLKKIHAISYTLGIFSVDINYIVIN